MLILIEFTEEALKINTNKDDIFMKKDRRNGIEKERQYWKVGKTETNQLKKLYWYERKF